MIEAYLMSDTSTERVQKHRKKKKRNGYNQISIFLTNTAYERLKIIKKVTKRSYSQIFNFLIIEKKF